MSAEGEEEMHSGVRINLKSNLKKLILAGKGIVDDTIFKDVYF